jgi:radical SAM protein with 4Fe4S-binding SPASM domain
MSVPEIGYGEFGARLSRSGGAARVPLSGSIEITFKCNLRCVHCYIPDYSGRGEMSTTEIKRILSETADEGCLWMLLTGGEVLCRSDFPEIYMHAKRLGFLLTVFSNGTLIDERIADLLAEYRPFGIEFTLYGLSDETYLRTTGFPGRFTRVRRAIDLLLERKVALSLKAVAIDPLRGEIEKMAEFCASLGVRFRYDAIVHGRLDGSLAPTQVRSSPDTVVEYDATDAARFAEWLKYYKQYVKPAPSSPYLMSCGAGVNSFHVTPQGMLLSCEALPLDGYDLRRGTFREGWYGAVGDIRQRRAEAFNVCAPCELKALCDRCPATALMETGSPDGWIPYYCEITHRRAALLEDAIGNVESAAQYRAHAEKVKAGWTPEGAILPRATALAAGGAGCSSGGGCAASGCSRAASTQTQSPALLQIERSPADAGATTEVGR